MKNLIKNLIRWAMEGESSSETVSTPVHVVIRYTRSISKETPEPYHEVTPISYYRNPGKFDLSTAEGRVGLGKTTRNGLVDTDE